MKSGYYWKWFFVVFVVAWAITEMSPPKNQPLVDYFALQVDRSDATKTETIDGIISRAKELESVNPGREYANVLDAVGTADLTPLFPNIKTDDSEQANRAILNALQQGAAGQIRLGLDLQGGISFLVAMQTNKLRDDQDKTVVLAQAVEVLRKRLDKFGVAEPSLQPVGEDRILIQLPGLSEVDYESARATLTKPAYLEFRLVHEQSQQLLAQGMLAPGYEILSEKVKDPGPNGAERTLEYLVKKKPEQGLTGKHLSQAAVYPDPMTGRPKIDFQMTSEGASLFADVTTQNTGRQLAIVLDGELKSAPSIRGPIVSGRGEISGNYDLKEAFELANVLENPLEAPVAIVEEQTVEPTLGRDSIQSGIKASLFGLILVAGFMAGYYLLAGLIANFALLLNIVILLGVLCSVDATLTLPGIAGIVLTIGMAVDANVLILERIREELTAGKSTKGSIEAGYNKAFGTIFDANVTTLIASVILIFMGKGPVQGFGVTLTIGILASMFTALVVTRLVFQGLLSSGAVKTVSMMKLGILHNHQFDFMKHWKRWFSISWALIVVGLLFGLVRGGSVLGVDFAGGDSQVFSFEEATEVGQLRTAIEELEIGSTQISYQQSLGTGNQTLKITSAFGTGQQIDDLLKEKFPESGYKQIKSAKVGGIVGKEIQKSAIISVVLALFGILFYVALRYEFSFAVGAVIAVIHDILMTLGWFFLTGRELNAPMVAAILTVIGFSINDTIVIFDRIREDLRLGVRGTFREIMNSALNKCLSRTIITSGTTFLAAFSLYIFGGSVINDFSFTFLIGIITGTYSSIYIASSIVLWWTKGEKPDLSEISPDVVLNSASPEQP
ncbi:protein translocase subunit SecD [Verrucomicrobia bacterium]|jgi:SecD/SecF fusion protein|nr:protein translocase subunit SecD [Verrucomicrobiota bacterium]